MKASNREGRGKIMSRAFSITTALAAPEARFPFISWSPAQSMIPGEFLQAYWLTQRPGVQ